MKNFREILNTISSVNEDSIKQNITGNEFNQIKDKIGKDAKPLISAIDYLFSIRYEYRKYKDNKNFDKDSQMYIKKILDLVDHELGSLEDYISNRM